jgi:hypothetical protein
MTNVMISKKGKFSFANLSGYNISLFFITCSDYILGLRYVFNFVMYLVRSLHCERFGQNIDLDTNEIILQDQPEEAIC